MTDEFMDKQIPGRCRIHSQQVNKLIELYTNGLKDVFHDRQNDGINDRFID